MKKIFILLFVSSLFVANSAYAQKVETRILFVLDGSGSMYARMGTDTRINVAKRLLTRLSDSLEQFENLELGLRVYGHTSPKNEKNCKDTRLEVPFSPNNHLEIKTKVKDIKPKGTTLIAYTLQEAAYDFPKTPGVRNVIILITDGIEECDGDPCAVSQALQKQGVMLRPFIIGLGMDAEFRAQFECVGRFFEAQTEDDFKDVMNVVISQAINNTSAQVNLLDVNGKPTETDVAMTFTDAKSGRIIYNYMHTMNYKGNPDTLYVDPSYSYDVKIHTIPPVYKKGIQLTAGIHNTIAIEAPQGYLNLQVDGVTNYKNLQALLLDHQSGKILHVQDFNTKQKYLIGKYDVEILSLPRIHQDEVSISQNKTTTLQIQQPGKLNVITRKDLIIGVYYMHKGELTLVKNLYITGNQEITVLQPGDYRIVYRESKVKETLTTREKEFTVKSGEITHININ